ncbi:SDR family NAD(P)-dependent oxidoreductase [Methylobrevis pamukkalensis]|uniref:Putative oxidoreductase SadH n=1 Tax=Methylobrevis pamukkalensis TaxID=1439726 RepID=A0A1E3H0C2_9HYPH|nr:SDR family NAD(P)-dependent oxidoreductase [Methylobrevis pamukkalensis]ODN69734.1 putative oxidoreductase SadH [Methylobrevis pamukkalensis]
MSRSPAAVILTGASSGIGRALALGLSAPGVRIGLVGRDEVRMAQIAELCREKGAAVEVGLIDVRDRAGIEAFISEFDDATPVDLVIANAGVTTGLGPGRTPEDPAESRRLLEINYGGMLNTVEPLLGRMQARRRGQIVVVSSLAGLRALPDMPSYSATKAAVRAYGISLRGWLRPFGIGVTVVCPGFVTSPMSARHQGARPFEITADKAAGIILRGIRARRSLVAFPLLLLAGMRLGGLLPPALSDWFMGPFAAEVEPDGEARRRRTLSD